ncbi:hypothetical protein ADK70_33860 [Streptomyces rimosus subsp. pseudoverticillatus]|uniref:hypothetical protein n=1 Tax=Streptomyces rimosus TaxID=1927 RepID=UPI0006B27D95|nr:hypothetical protein [Streptomyces rimosus]KOT78541.1 hypothetical protein ADK70_33860 [Streptomyces rimosus subsp. pseudoverticillatus]
MSTGTQWIATPATKKLQITVGVCSVVFTIGTTVQNFVIINTELVEMMMQAGGSADPTASAPGFTLGLRIVGCLYILGNAAGILALRSRPRALWWIVLAVNCTQGLGFWAIPPSMWDAATNLYGTWAIIPSAVTDGGALLLTVTMVLAMAKYRTAWAQQRTVTPAVPQVPGSSNVTRGSRG